MQYHDVYFGFDSANFEKRLHYCDLRFDTTEKLIAESIRWTRSDSIRYTAITIQNKLVFACYWDDFGFNVRRFENAVIANS